MLFFLLGPAFDVATADDSTPLLLDQGTRDFLRLHEVDGRPASLQVSVVRFVPQGGYAKTPGLTVDLVSAVHVADVSYYEALNELLDDYDAVLYELVAPEGTRIPAGGPEREGPGGIASRLQLGMKDLLDLSFQLEEVDYTGEHFVHADLSPKQFSESMENRGESFFQLLLKAWMTALAAPQQATVVSDVELLTALFSSDRTRKLKTVMARQFDQMDSMMALLDGGEKGSTLITVRNERALEVLREQLDEGRKRVAIFYGAGHMPDFAQRLATDFSLRPESRSWLDAWDLKPQ
ncbi:MAG: hypothetical protein AAF736_16290 [Pseudomonadota bacterium]